MGFTVSRKMANYLSLRHTNSPIITVSRKIS